MSFSLLSLVLGLTQGVLHALGPDHCAAMATLSRDRRAALTTALRFAASHTLVLAGLATGCLLMGMGLSEAFEKWAEVMGGAVLMALALSALFFPQVLEHGHPHLGPHGPAHRHPRLPLATGALMAFSGARSLLLALPPLVVGGSNALSGLTFLSGFAAGIFLGASGVGWVLALFYKTLNETVFRQVQKGVALASGFLGAYWIWVRIF